ncbi:hypothetical protein QTP88_019142 [Uroleucon formosanum]
MDGSLQSTYKQMFGSDCGYGESLLFISLVPLQLKNKESNKVLWKNPKLSSSRLYRSIKLLWKKKTIDTLKEREKIITKQISRLDDYGSNNVIIKYNLLARSQGFGTTNDGNTAGRFFSDPQLISQITQVDENLINRFDTKSYVLASGFEINYMTIEQLCTKTAEYCVRLYP